MGWTRVPVKQNGMHWTNIKSAFIITITLTALSMMKLLDLLSQFQINSGFTLKTYLKNMTHEEAAPDPVYRDVRRLLSFLN